MIRAPSSLSTGEISGGLEYETTYGPDLVTSEFVIQVTARGRTTHTQNGCEAGMGIRLGDKNIFNLIFRTIGSIIFGRLQFILELREYSKDSSQLKYLMS